MKSNVVAIVAAGLALGSCGGGGGGGGGTTATGVAVVPGSPTPTPTPTPSPTPTPAASYTTFDNLTGDQNFPAACADFDLSTSPPGAFLSSPFGVNFSLAYTAATQVYAVSYNNLVLTFGPADIDTTATSTTKIYVKGTDRFFLFRPSIGGVVTDYARGYSLTTIAQGTGRRSQFSCIIGVQTRLNDIPPTPIVNFTSTAVGATVYETPPGTSTTKSYGTVRSSTLSMVVNLTNGTVKATMHLIGTPPTIGGVTGADVDFGTFDGEADIDPATGGFLGRWFRGGQPISGTFSGAFFGPQGKEIAFTYGMSTTVGGVQNFSSQGTAVGRR